MGFTGSNSALALISGSTNMSTYTSNYDPQGEYDDWIEIRNFAGVDVDLIGHYLSDEANNPRKWRFPDGTRIPANGYLIV